MNCRAVLLTVLMSATLTGCATGTSGETDIDAHADASTGVPDASTGMPDGSTGMPDASTAVSDTSTGIPDASTGIPDASTGIPDASTGVPDAGHPDAAVPDAAPPDAAPPDAAPPDAAPPDAAPLGPVGFIGSPCTAADDCTYTGAVCLTADFPAGTCSEPCTNLCTDRTGHPITFCVATTELPASAAWLGDGACISRCDYTIFPSGGCRTGYQCVNVPRANEPTTLIASCLPTP